MNKAQILVTILWLIVLLVIIVARPKSSQDARSGEFQEANGDWHQIRIEYRRFVVKTLDSSDGPKTVASWLVSDTLPKDWTDKVQRAIYFDGKEIFKEDITPFNPQP